MYHRSFSLNHINSQRDQWTTLLQLVNQGFWLIVSFRFTIPNTVLSASTRERKKKKEDEKDVTTF